MNRIIKKIFTKVLAFVLVMAIVAAVLYAFNIDGLFVEAESIPTEISYFEGFGSNLSDDEIHLQRRDTFTNKTI